MTIPFQPIASCELIQTPKDVSGCEIFDSHVHLTDCPPEIIPMPALDQGSLYVISSAVRPNDWDKICCLARKSRGILPACGIHPLAVQETAEHLHHFLGRLEKYAPYLAAIGEIGLDFSLGRTNTEVQFQRLLLLEQLKLACRNHLPVILHIRQAWDVFFDILDKNDITHLDGLCHNFTGSRDIQERLLKYGLHISYSAPILNQNAERLRTQAASIPLTRLLVDTDAPYHHRPPGTLQDIVQQIANTRRCSFSAIRNQINTNFFTLMAGYFS